MSDFRETLYTIDARGNRKWVYPTVILGKFRKFRKLISAALILFYVSLPWITINGKQAVFLDILHRRFTFFGTTFWATDTKFLFLTLIILGLSLFFFTAIFGRVWCGWACPETVFLEFVFRPIETLIEGNAAARKKLDQSPWDLRKIRIKLTKHISFAFIAWFLASTLLAYFVGREVLFTMMQDYPWNNLPTFIAVMFFTGIMIFQFAWFREQFCTVMCPYARFQSVLIDDSSLSVGYDEKRGEPRGKASDPQNGACVDCGLCIKVCPTGIDIRNGLQLECVQCAACIDACNSVMVKIGREPNLIRYDTEKGLKGEKFKFLRPRVIIYGCLWLALISVMLFNLNTRKLSDVAIFHSTKDSIFTRDTFGNITNHLELSISNKSEVNKLYHVSIAELPEIKVAMPIHPFPLAPNSTARVPLFLTFDHTLLKSGKRKVRLEVSDEEKLIQTLEVDLLGPG